jgi:protein-S-isoprenylcysteine O-methyltransferase Ste14
MINLPPVKWAIRHPRLAAWIVLSVGMVVLLVIEARDVGLLATQWAALIVACILVAGACVWIISWEDEDEVPAAGETTKSETSEPTQTPPIL